MKPLTQSDDIRAAICDLLRDPKDERIIAVAYVGADARSFLPHVCSKITIYCWPQAGGTNPNAIEDLLRDGVVVHFVKRLHAKVYWSRKRGALVGSANLTDNALGEDGLKEAAVQLPAGNFDMDSFVDSLECEADFGTALTKLHEEHLRFLQRNPRRGKSTTDKTPIPSFPDWFKGKGRAEWRLGWYEEDDKAPKDAVDKLEQETGTREYATYLGSHPDNDLKAGVFTLSFRVREEGDQIRISKLEWWVPETLTKTSVKSWSDYRHIWFARRPPGQLSGT